jgi:hypothetical protein
MTFKTTWIVAVAFVVVGGAAMTACSTTPAPEKRAAAGGNGCFLASMVNGYNGNPDGSVDITVGVDKYYRLQTNGMCNDIDWHTQVALKTTSGSDFVCGPYDAEFIVPNPTFARKCPITAITPLTKEQYLAARAK